MQSGPLVTVLMPTYNRADYLPEAIDSVLAQTYSNFELFVVDDGSTDNTREVVEPYLQDARVRYFYKSNGGQSSGRNFGFKHSNGEYICFLDSDNMWLPDKLENCITAALAHPEYGIIYGDNIAIDEHGEELHKVRMNRHSGWITAKLLFDNFVTINTATLKRECYLAVDGLDESFLRAPDYEFWLRLSTRYQFLYVPKYMALYRIMPDQISSDKDGRFKANREIIEHFLGLHPDALTAGQKRRGLSQFFNRKARYESSRKRVARATGDWLRAVAYHPFWIGLWKTPLRIALDLFR